MGRLTGYTIAVTGKIGGFNRTEITNLLHQHGAQVVNSVDSAQTVVIVNEWKVRSSTKFKSAVKHGAWIVHIVDLRNYLESFTQTFQARQASVGPISSWSRTYMSELTQIVHVPPSILVTNQDIAALIPIATVGRLKISF